MLIALYVFLVFLCVGLLQRKLPLDPMLIAVPCALLVPGSLSTLLSIYISMVPACIGLALWVVVNQRHTLHIELITRYAAGAGLGGFVGIQILSFQPSAIILVSILSVLTVLTVLCKTLKVSFEHLYASRLSLIAGLLLSAVQTISLSSGRALTDESGQTTPATKAVVWLVTMVGMLISWLALPNVDELSLDWRLLMASVCGLLVGLLGSFRVKIHQFESAVLYWVVSSMCLSVWLHFWITY